ncbi:hypothetical protein [Candidatus Magnetaquiglobus chichijimensis]|uniref:hypothetical protein n=1 Tax=Candidatus Magnetaquiglobus chichijimensis TaxID=3141448 RepID=UPI003B972ED7
MDDTTKDNLVYLFQTETQPEASPKRRQKSIVRRLRKIHLLSVVGVILVLMAGVGWWRYQQSLPLTEEQRTILSALVSEAERKSGETRNRLWEKTKISLKVRRLEDIQRGDFEKAKEILLIESR